MSNLPPHFIEASGGTEAAPKAPMVGVTADGKPVQGLYKLQETGVSTETLVKTAREFLAGLSERQRSKTLLPLEIYQRRFCCNAFMPYEPHGLLLEYADHQVQQRAIAMIEATFSLKGSRDVRTAMKLNALLGDLIGDAGRNLSEWMYWISVFEDPSADQP